MFITFLTWLSCMDKRGPGWHGPLLFACLERNSKRSVCGNMLLMGLLPAAKDDLNMVGVDAALDSY